MSTTPLLEYRHVSKTFGRTKVLKDVSFTIPSGKIVGLLGQNGAGKSTIIKLANDLLTPTSGEVLYDGEPLGVRSKHDIAYLPERTYLDRTMTIAQALHYFTDFYDNFDLKKAQRLLQDLNLTLEQRIAHLSKGMQEKLQLILVMSRHAKLYILDEPLGGIDPATREYILDTILNNFDKGSSILLSTHLIADVERILDEVILVAHGKIVLTSDADALRKKTKSSIDEYFRMTFVSKSHKS